MNIVYGSNQYRKYNPNSSLHLNNQKVPNSVSLITSLAKKLDELQVDKSFVEWDLDLIEATAKELDEMSEDEEEEMQ